MIIDCLHDQEIAIEEPNINTNRIEHLESILNSLKESIIKNLGAQKYFNYDVFEISYQGSLNVLWEILLKIHNYEQQRFKNLNLYETLKNSIKNCKSTNNTWLESFLLKHNQSYKFQISILFLGPKDPFTIKKMDVKKLLKQLREEHSKHIDNLDINILKLQKKKELLNEIVKYQRLKLDIKLLKEGKRPITQID